VVVVKPRTAYHWLSYNRAWLRDDGGYGKVAWTVLVLALVGVVIRKVAM
jgi:hypothetical protein